MSTTEVRMIPTITKAEHEHEMQEVKGDQLSLTEHEAIWEGNGEKVKPIETAPVEASVPAEKSSSADDAKGESKTITVDLADVTLTSVKEDEPGMSSLSQGSKVTYQKVEEGWILVSLVKPSDTTPKVETAVKSSRTRSADRSRVGSSASSASKTEEASVKPKPKKVRTVQFAEGTTLPIVDVTPKPEKKVKNDAVVQAKGPVQMVTDTMQVLKRYENEFLGAQAKVRQWEQKRIMLTIAGICRVVVLTQGAVMLGMLAVILAMVSKA
ncbi:hypothetical protein FFLO_04065 [Filobasidium floriforme]|uniref:Uncharacterized protein n=1 Tax=Filobasidium floriforme TaxID=5210 RepID=A0A8K0NPM1_9TREE|nr:uncharacterized protein HD553DRAFT_343422 [Filobasidium floriforme]KAG7531839.1 hypothetical protein FFLO_04065 [Filobasidium floriforme]KAH8082658.1 hypothetical protein HD553DRAFT_343422 [Filobasidium floriforme]